jgi:hypothetical protein
MNFVEENPWTSGLAVLGILIAELVLPSPMQAFLTSISFNNVSQDPAGTLTGFVIGYPIAIIGEGFVRLISGAIGALVGAIIGIFIDARNNLGGDL